VSNPYFNRGVFSKDASQQRQAAGAPTMQAPGQYGQQGHPQQGGYPQQGQFAQQAGYGQAGFVQQAQAYQQGGGFEQQYMGASAAPQAGGRMTYDDVIVKSGVVLGTVIAVALATAYFVPLEQALVPWIVGALGGLVLGLVNAFKRSPSPALILAYAAFEGLFLGAFSKFMEYLYPGIVIQAVLATMAVALASLALFAFRIVRVTPKLTRFLLIGMVGYGLFALTNFVLQITGISQDPWGLRTGVEIMGIPLGVFVGIFAVVLAAISLITDFDSIERGVKAGVPAKYSWAAAFGLAVTLIWLYIEIVRILAILRGSD